MPWQSPQDKLSPGRVAQGFAVILAAIGTPAKPPKTRGKSPGATRGKTRPARIRYPTVKKRAARQAQSVKPLPPPSTDVA